MLSFFTAAAQPTLPTIIWQKTIGGSGADVMAAMAVGANKTVVMCGSSKSPVSGNKTGANVGANDIWVVKTDSLGNLIWDKTFGGIKDDIAAAIITTADGGYLVGGTSISNASATKTSNSFGESKDFWVLKLDANGNKTWDKTLGGIFTEKLTSITQLPSGNYVVGGYSHSDDTETKTSENHGSQNTADYWTVTLSPSGDTLSQNDMGGTSDDILTSVIASGNNGTYSSGNSYSLRLPGYKTLAPVGNNDYWVVRSDLSGVKNYEGNFGGNRSDYLTSTQALADGSLMLGGYSNSPISFAKTGDFLGVTDFWLVKVRPNGNKQWDRTIGGALGDYLVSMQQTKDKGFILGGYSASNIGNDKTENSKGGNDFWIVKTDSLGRVQWDKTIGGSGDDKLAGIYELDSNQYIMAGSSASVASGDKTSGIIGGGSAADFWLVRLSASALVLPVSLVSFTGTIQQQNVLLNWSVTNQVNTNRFEVERSADGVAFAKVATVAAAGNATALKTYQSLDVNAATLPYATLYYRLKMIDNDGAFSYSNTVPLQLNVTAKNDFFVTPNPVKNKLTIKYKTVANSSVSFVLYSASGKKVLKTILPATSVESVHSFNVAGLAKGVYYMTMHTGINKETITKTVVKE